MTATPLSILAKVAPDVGDRGAAIVEVIRPLRSRERTHLPAGPKSALAENETIEAHTLNFCLGSAFAFRHRQLCAYCATCRLSTALPYESALSRICDMDARTTKRHTLPSEYGAKCVHTAEPLPEFSQVLVAPPVC